MTYHLGFLLLLALQVGSDRSVNPHSTSDDIVRGEKLYMGTCAGCHGPTGDGGKGANIALPKLSRAPDERALFRVIRGGIPGTEMPRAWQMTDREVWQIAAYVRTLGKVQAQPVTGNAGRGAELYRIKGNCAQCHMVAGQGGRMGPDLSEIGARRSVSYLRQSLTDPEADFPANFLQVRAVTRDGRKLNGVRLNEDTFSVQFRDFSDRLYSFFKHELAELHRDKGKSPMPPYRGVLTETEIEDVVAYLVSLRGAQ